MTPSLRIAGCGMCCAVGFSAPAARAAIRAGLDAFETSDFVDERGEPILVARVPLGEVQGPRRLATMFASAFAECAEGAPALDPAGVALLLLVAERGRPGATDAWAAACLAACEQITGQKLHPASRVLPLGRAGLAAALAEARALLEGGAATGLRRVVVGGADSYLNAHTINHFLRRGRILATESNDGFIPGEGAGVLLLELAAPDAPGLHLRGAASAEEPAPIAVDAPTRAVGMSLAVRGALAQSGRALSEMSFRMSDAAGESYFFREAGLAATRVMDRRAPHQPLLHITDAVGETGAAIGPLSLAYLAGAMPRGHAPGPLGLLHLSGDGPARAALVVEHVAPPA